jgi:hypothetical protein
VVMDHRHVAEALHVVKPLPTSQTDPLPARTTEDAHPMITTPVIIVESQDIGPKTATKSRESKDTSRDAVYTLWRLPNLP